MLITMISDDAGYDDDDDDDVDEANGVAKLRLDRWYSSPSWGLPPPRPPA